MKKLNKTEVEALGRKIFKELLIPIDTEKEDSLKQVVSDLTLREALPDDLWKKVVDFDEWLKEQDYPFSNYHWERFLSEIKRKVGQPKEGSPLSIAVRELEKYRQAHKPKHSLATIHDKIVLAQIDCKNLDELVTNVKKQLGHEG